jgi:2',3'-cyclic-nucleotide 2'-phosphodiesterase (5'-nucleotidase family)
MPILHVLHTNDMHNRLTNVQAEHIRAIKERLQPNVLLLDAGDAVSAGNLAAKKHEAIFDRMRTASYDAMAMGNRESHPTRGALHKKLTGAPCPVLAANLRFKEDVRPPRVVQEYVEFGFGGEEDDEEEFIISVLGLAPQITAPDSWWARVTDFVFDEPKKTGPGLARKLRPDCDLLIALTHIGYEQDVVVCESPDIDLVLGGHSHRAIMPPERHGHAYYAATECYATHLGHLTVTFDAGGITEIEGELIPLK